MLYGILADSHLFAILRTAIGCLLVVSGIGKLFYLAEFRKIVLAYDLLPKFFTRAFSVALPVFESLNGTALFFDRSSHPAEISAAILFAVFGVAIAVNLIRGNASIPCGCFGRTTQNVSWHLVARNLALSGLALVTATKQPNVALLLIAPYGLSALKRILAHARKNPA